VVVHDDECVAPGEAAPAPGGEHLWRTVKSNLASAPPVNKCQEEPIDAADEEEVEFPEERSVPAVDNDEEQDLEAVDEQATAEPAHSQQEVNQTQLLNPPHNEARLSLACRSKLNR